MAEREGLFAATPLIPRLALGTAVASLRRPAPPLRSGWSNPRVRTPPKLAKQPLSVKQLKLIRAHIWRRGRDSNPRTPFGMLLTFQASAFDHSATSPLGTPMPNLRGPPRVPEAGEASKSPAPAASWSAFPPCWWVPACSAGGYPGMHRGDPEAAP